MAYDPEQSPYTAANWLRCRVGDTNATYQLFTDNEISAMLTKMSNDGTKAAGVLFLILSLDAIRLTKMLDACGSITLDSLTSMYLRRAQAHLGGTT